MEEGGWEELSWELILMAGIIFFTLSLSLLCKTQISYDGLHNKKHSSLMMICSIKNTVHLWRCAQYKTQFSDDDLHNIKTQFSQDGFQRVRHSSLVMVFTIQNTVFSLWYAQYKTQISHDGLHNKKHSSLMMICSIKNTFHLWRFAQYKTQFSDDDLHNIKKNISFKMVCTWQNTVLL